MTVVPMGFALYRTSRLSIIHYESVTTQLARSTPTAVKKAVLLDKATIT